MTTPVTDKKLHFISAGAGSGKTRASALELNNRFIIAALKNSLTFNDL